MIRFQSDRLLIRDIINDDLDVLLQLYTKKENMKFISDGRTSWTKEQLNEKYKKCNRNNDSGTGVFVVCLKSTNTIIGEVGLFDSFGDDKKLEMGYILDETTRRQGFGTELCNALILYGFNKLYIDTLISRMYCENMASVRVSEKCGMNRMKSGKTVGGRSFYEYEISNFLLVGGNKQS